MNYQEEYERLRAAIIKHRSQKADDRCWIDDRELYYALGDGVEADFQVGDKAAMLQNCARFIEMRCAGGKWKSYAELEKEITLAHQALDMVGVLVTKPGGYTNYTIAERIVLLLEEMGWQALG